jgi:hypothetical protein
MLKPIEVSNLNHCSKHGYRFKNLSWQTTSEISKYITSLEAENARLRDILKWAVTYVKTEHERGSNLPTEVKVLELAQAELEKE